MAARLWGFESPLPHPPSHRHHVDLYPGGSTICLVRSLRFSIAFLLAVLLLACGSTDKRLPTEFRWADADPEYLDPTRVSDEVGVLLDTNIFEGLTCQPPDNGEPVPCGAERWETSEDGLVWTFYLRRDARWSDGRDVVAQDYVFAITRLAGESLGAPFRGLIRWIAGGTEILEGRTMEEPFGVRAVNSHTLEFRLAYPAPFLTQLTSMPAFYPVRADVLRAHGDDWTEPGNIVSNGAYTLTDYRPLDRIVLDRNPYYWDVENVQVERATMLISENVATTYRMYIAKEIDWVNSLQRSYIPRLREKRPDELVMSGAFAAEYLRFNTRIPPFDDPRVRRAFSLAIDRRSMVNYITRGGEAPAARIVPPLGREALSRSSEEAIFDPARARRLLAEAGYPNGVGFPEVTYVYNTQELRRMMAETLQQMWAEHLGVQVRLENMEWKVYLARTQEGDYELTRQGWMGDFPDPMAFLEIFREGDGSNHGGWADPNYEALLDEALTEADPERRWKLLDAAEDILIEDVPAAPLYHSTTPQLLRPGIEGFEPHPLGRNLFKYLRL